LHRSASVLASAFARIARALYTRVRVCAMSCNCVSQYDFRRFCRPVGGKATQRDPAYTLCVKAAAVFSIFANFFRDWL
jgi:hypothetical protein